MWTLFDPPPAKPGRNKEERLTQPSEVIPVLKTHHRPASSPGLGTGGGIIYRTHEKLKGEYIYSIFLQPFFSSRNFTTLSSLATSRCGHICMKLFDKECHVTFNCQRDKWAIVPSHRIESRCDQIKIGFCKKFESYFFASRTCRSQSYNIAHEELNEKYVRQYLLLLPERRPKRLQHCVSNTAARFQLYIHHAIIAHQKNKPRGQNISIFEGRPLQESR